MVIAIQNNDTPPAQPADSKRKVTKRFTEEKTAFGTQRRELSVGEYMRNSGSARWK